jgi:hypothetical protein
MRTEAEYQSLFIENGHLSGAEGEAIAANYWKDMTTHLNFYFSHEAREEITIRAAKELARQVSEGTALTQAWQNVIRDFLQNNYWNQVQQSKKPVQKKTEEQKIFWKLFKYIWIVIQSTIILKIAIYYFGLEGASHPDQVNPNWVWLFFGFSVCSLGFFAYRNHKQE